MTVTTATLRDWWCDTHATEATAAQMWHSTDGRQREHALMATELVKPFTSLYEVGCGSGPNLRLLRERYPTVRLGGSEPGETMAQWAADRLQIHIDRVPLPELAIKHKDWDVILAMYVLAYLDEEDVILALRRMRDAAPRALILAEPTGGVLGSPYGLASRNGALPEWYHDYARLLPASGWAIQWRWLVMPPVDGLNVLTIAVPI